MGSRGAKVYITSEKGDSINTGNEKYKSTKPDVITYSDDYYSIEKKKKNKEHQHLCTGYV